MLIILGIAIPPIQSTIDKDFSDLNSIMGHSPQAQSGGSRIWIYLVSAAAVSAGLTVLFGVIGKMKILGTVEYYKRAPKTPAQTTGGG